MKNLTEVCWFYNISNKTLTGAKPMSVTFNKVKEFIRVYDGFRYLVLFRDEKYDLFYNRIRYLTRVKSGNTYGISHNFSYVL